MVRRRVLLVSLLLALFVPTIALDAQGPAVDCPAIVQTALDTVGVACDRLDRNEACYGHNQVEATFWQPHEGLVFAAPADRVPVPDLQSVTTAPLDLELQRWGVAVLQVQPADLPETLPGQAVVFLLMGNSMVENAVPPEEAAGPVTPLTAWTTTRTILRRQPASSASGLDGDLPPETRLQLVGTDETGGWYEVLLTSGEAAWIASSVVRVDATEALEAMPVTSGAAMAPRYGPMQAFYLTTGLGSLACNEAPNALVINSPDGIETALNLNGLEMMVGSTTAFTIAEWPGNEATTVGLVPRPRLQRALVGALLDGRLLQTQVGAMEVILTHPGQAFAVTLNQYGRVDETSRLIDLASTPVASILQHACRNAARSGLFEIFNPAACDGAFTFFTPLPAPLPLFVYVPAAPALVGVSPPEAVSASCQYPQFIHPQPNAELRGGGTHLFAWSQVEGASSYRLDILPDTVNSTGYSASFLTGATSHPLYLDDLPSRPEGWGYFWRVIPLDASGAPLCPVEGAPTRWFQHRDLDLPPATEEPAPPPEERERESRERPTATPTPTPVPTEELFGSEALETVGEPVEEPLE